MKRKTYECYQQSFTPKEYEASQALLSLKTSTFQEEEEDKKSKLEKIRSCEINRTKKIHSTQNPNVVVMNNNEHYNNAPPELPPVRGLRNYVLECCNKPFEKQLKQSDLRKDQNRLLLSKSHVEKYFLPLLREGEEDVKEGIEVIVYDVEGDMFSMTFKLWSDKYYVLMGGWKTFFIAHSLQMLRDHVTVWMFRHSETNNLCFALSVGRRQIENV